MEQTVRTGGVTLDAEGYFQRGGRRIFPVGVNYWPASSGVEMWKAWDEAEIRHDLDLVRDLGLNCVRFFLRWPDFEPGPGRYDEAMFERLARFAGWCRERGLLAHPTLVVGFMSGGFFWPGWKGERNLYADPGMRRASAAYCAKAARTLRPFADSILALDLGNELDCADAGGARPAEIEAWCAEAAAAIRSEWPDALVVSGLDSSPVMRECPWRIDRQPGTDFLSVHNYPVQEWNVVPFDGMTDPLCQEILPFNTLVARAFGPVMVQEFSTILANGTPECEAYNGPVVRDCRANGANGFLWWCLRDIRAPIHPYLKCGFESRLGLLGDDDRVKPPLRALVRDLAAIAADPATPPPPDASAAVGLYWPAEVYSTDNSLNPGNDLARVYRRLLADYHLLRLLGRPVRIVRGDRPLPAGLRTLLVAGSAVTGGETDALAAWVGAGGNLLWSGASWTVWSRAADAVIGASPVDMRPSRTVRAALFGRTWELGASGTGNSRTIARPATARVLAEADDGAPLVLLNRFGGGRCLTVLANAEDSVFQDAADRGSRDAWRFWLEGILSLLSRD